MRKIVHIEHPVLREQAREVALDEIKSLYTQEVINDMKQALAGEKFGVAIAAPQVGEAVRIFIVAGTTLAAREGGEYTPEAYPDAVFINPEVLKASKKTKIGDEGCLSVPGKYGTKVRRNDKITISYYDEAGTKHERGASGFLARVFQHEIDHLNGILYIDDALEVIDVDENLKPIA